MRTIEASGKTIDEAIFNGLKELEVSIDEVEIDIVQHETKGILGIGAKPAIVKLTEREPEQIVVPDYMNEAERRANRRREDRPRRDDRPRREDRPGRDRNNRRDDRPRREDKPQRSEEAAEVKEETVTVAEEISENGEVREEIVEEVSEVRPPRRERNNRRERSNRREREEQNAKPKIEYTLEAAENNEAAQFLREMLRLMNIDAQVLANVSEEDGVRLRIDSSGMGVLIGHRGETLDAIQYLTSLHVNRSRKEHGFTRITVDTEGYRDRREETLARLARKVASQVRSTGRARTLEPMNPYERRVLHATLQNNPYVTTYSEGEEPNRRVVIAPKGREE